MYTTRARDYGRPGLIDLVGDAMRDELSTWCRPVEATRAGTEPAAIVTTEPGVVWS
jgi:hypothetical protein